MADRVSKARINSFYTTKRLEEKDRNFGKVKPSWQGFEYLTQEEAFVRNANSRPYNTYPLTFEGYIFFDGSNYYRMLRTPIPSRYLQIQMSDKEIEERVGQELVLTSWDALEAAYKYADQYLDNPGWLVRRKDLEHFFNKQTEKNADNELEK